MFEFLNNLLEFLSTSLEFFVDFAIYILKFALWFFAYLVSLISSIFPNSPFDVSGFVVGIEKYVGYLNWIVPLNNIMTISSGYVEK